MFLPGGKTLQGRGSGLRSSVDVNQQCNGRSSLAFAASPRPKPSPAGSRRYPSQTTAAAVASSFGVSMTRTCLQSTTRRPGSQAATEVTARPSGPGWTVRSTPLLRHFPCESTPDTRQVRCHRSQPARAEIMFHPCGFSPLRWLTPSTGSRYVATRAEQGSLRFEAPTPATDQANPVDAGDSTPPRNAFRTLQRFPLVSRRRHVTARRCPHAVYSTCLPVRHLRPLETPPRWSRRHRSNEYRSTSRTAALPMINLEIWSCPQQVAGSSKGEGSARCRNTRIAATSPTASPRRHRSAPDRPRRGGGASPKRPGGSEQEEPKPSQRHRTRRSHLTSTKAWSAPRGRPGSETATRAAPSPTHTCGGRSRDFEIWVRPRPNIRTQGHHSSLAGLSVDSFDSDRRQDRDCPHRSEGGGENRASAHRWAPQGLPQESEHPSDSTSPRTAPRCHPTAPAQHRAVTAEAEGRRSLGRVRLHRID
jgi:hypothetical protein